MISLRKLCRQWFQQANSKAGIYCSAEGFALVIIGKDRGKWQLTSAHYFDTKANTPATSAGSEVTHLGKPLNQWKRLAYHVASDDFQVHPLLLPAEIDLYEAIACARLKLQQQRNSTDWLWDVELNGQNSKLWLLAKAHLNNLITLMPKVGISSKKICSWKPRTLLENILPEAEEMVATKVPDYLLEKQREITYAACAALNGSGKIRG